MRKAKTNIPGKWVRFTAAMIRKGWPHRMAIRNCPLAKGFRAAGYEDVVVGGTTVDLDHATYSLDGPALAFYRDKIINNRGKIPASFELFVPDDVWCISNIRPLQRLIPKKKKPQSRA